MTTMSLAEMYSIRGRFRRSARIDSDLGDGNALEGYSLNDSLWEVLRQLFAHLGTGQQRAFTWTGPYGAGKSSLALLLASLVGPDRKHREIAERIVGPERHSILFGNIGVPNKGWLVVPVVGARSDIEPLVRDAFDDAVKHKWPTRKPNGLKEALRKEGTRGLIDGLVLAAEAATKTGGGLLLILDEMGKTLEGIADDGGDIQFFQELAEAFQRAHANCVVVGILHQAFQEYAARVGRAAQNEWAKVQGRYADIPFSVSQEDVVALVGEAIDGPRPDRNVSRLCRSVLADLEHPRYKGLEGFDKKLAACWPLHPLAALMLGPLSRSRFGQNERSTFSFLMSSEPEGFRSFLLENGASAHACYQPHRLWDYLQLNLEPVILASADGHRWSEAADAIDRARKLDDPLGVPVAKLIGLLDLFGRSFGLVASNGLIADSFPDQPKRRIGNALKKLQGASIAVFRKHLDAWALFAGSDVDLEAAIGVAYSRLGDSIASLRPYLPPAGPVVAKRHYHETGTLRWLDIRVLTAGETVAGIESLTKDKGQSGSFILVVADEGAKENDLGNVCMKAASIAGHEGRALAFGAAAKDNRLIDILREVAALERVASTTPELEGDAVARRELHGRLNSARSLLRDVLDQTVERATWHLPGGGIAEGSSVALSRLASDICDTIYFKAPTIHNELVNRDKPSSNAAAARRNLLHRMVDKSETQSLGIEGYPAEIGLYKSILEPIRKV